jgi:Na+-driven multidrug efflux pump
MGNKTMPMISSFIELAIKLITAIFIAPAVGFTGIVFCDPCAWLICMLLMIFCFHHSFKGQTIQIKP